MKKICYLLAIAGHALVLLLIMNTRFWVTIRPDPPRVIVVSIAEPPPPLFPGGVPARSRAGAAAAPGDPGSGPDGGRGGPLSGAGPGSPRPLLSFPAMGRLSLKSSPGGAFRLAPVGRSPEPWAQPLGPGPAPRPLRYGGASAYRPKAAAEGGGRQAGVLLPFDIREKAVADWTAAVLSRVERNWFIPASGRLAFSGRVRITLTIGRDGRRSSLVIDDADVPDLLARAAVHAVEASLPFPPIPSGVAGDSLAFTFVFAYNG